MKKVIDLKQEWVTVKEANWDKYPVFGRNDDGLPLYLVKSKIDGKLVLGKVWKGAAGHFAHEGKEVLLNDFKIWDNKAEWRIWNKDLKGMRVLGLNKDGKKVYAARARFKYGIHISMFIEGQQSVMIPWGGVSHEVKEFEVMVDDGTPGKSKLDKAIKEFKPIPQPFIEPGPGIDIRPRELELIKEKLIIQDELILE